MQGTVTKSEVISEQTNPDNQVYQLPHTIVSTELRPELKGSYGSRVRTVLRPRLVLEESFRQGTMPDYEQRANKNKIFVNEAHITIDHSPALQSTTGLQNFQWGPAELASPSNPLFRELGLDKSYSYETRGKALVRINYSPHPQFSVITIVEPVQNGEERPAWDRHFQQRGLIKTELSDSTQTNYLGLVVTASRNDRAQFGAYAHYELFIGFSSYMDFSSRQGSAVYFANFDEQGASFRQNRQQLTRWETSLVAGLRYVAENGWDYRLEAMRDDNAWTLDDRLSARSVLALAPTRANLQLYLQPGSLLPGQKFIYSSLRIPNWGPRDSLSLSLRTLHSEADHTARGFASLDSFIGNHFVMSAGMTSSWGRLNGELTQAYRWSSFLFGSWSW